MTKKLLYPMAESSRRLLQKQPQTVDCDPKFTVHNSSRQYHEWQRYCDSPVTENSNEEIAMITHNANVEGQEKEQRTKDWTESQISLLPPRPNLLQEIRDRGQTLNGAGLDDSGSLSQPQSPIGSSTVGASSIRQRDELPIPSAPPLPSMSCPQPPPSPPTSCPLFEPLKHSSFPNPFKTRLWQDQSGNFSVLAQLLDWRDGKVELHKTNGVKVAVPMSRLCGTDVEFVFQEMASRNDVVLPTKRMTPELEEVYSVNSGSALGVGGHCRREYVC